MARAASKKQAAQNAMMVRILTYGFLVTNFVHLFFVFGPFRSKNARLTWPIVRYAVTELIAGGLGLTLRGMARQGDDLGQAGLTSYMFDVIYITWFVHLGTALISNKFWYTYLVIPAYATYAAYTKLVVPFLFGGRDPLKAITSIFSSQSSRNAAQTTAATTTTTTTQDNEPALSKRQQKLQKRADRGDARVQVRQR